MSNRREFVSTGLKASLALVTGAVPALTSGCVHRRAGSSSTFKTLGSDSLKAHASARGLYAGAAVNVKLLRTDTDYARTLGDQFNMVVAETAMKWEGLRPASDRYFFDDADALVKFAESHRMKVRGHTFVWHQAIPKWFETTANKDNARQLLIDHITTVGRRYRGKIHSWDVVNEAVLPKDGRSDGLRKSVWLELLGPEYLDIAFRAAREADPKAILTYNEYGVEYDSDEESERRKFILQTIRRLRSNNVPLDAVGIQSHIKAGQPFAIGKGLREFMAAVRQMNLQIFLTELDVNEDDLPFDDVSQRDKAIADTYRNFLSVALSEPSVKAVLTWGVTDRYTWLNNGPTHKRKQPNRPQRALLFDNDYRPKEAFYAVRESFDQRPA